MSHFRFNPRWITHYVLPTLILVGSGFAFYALGSRPDVPRKPKKAAKATVVEVAEVQTLTGPLMIETTGEVVPHRVLSIASEVDGRIVYKHTNLRIGERIREGETILRIDPQRFALAVQRLDVVLRQAKSGLERTRQRQANLTRQLELARRSHQILKDDVQRIRKLQKSRATSVAEVGVVEKQELDARLAIEQLEGQQRSHEIELAEQELAQELAKVQLEEAKLDQAAAEVQSPVNGVVVAAPLEEHSMAQTGDLLISIEESGCLEVHCHLKLDEMAWVWNSKESVSAVEDSDGLRRFQPVAADVTYSAGGNRYTLQGYLIRQHGSGLDASTRTVACRVLIDGDQIASVEEGQIPLMTGMFVNVQVRCHPDRHLLQVPEQGIRTDGSVWLMRRGKLRSVPVSTILSRDGMAVIEVESNKIENGESVIVSPVANAKDGLAIRKRAGNDAEPHRPEPGSQSAISEITTTSGEPSS